jgi:hypothetical protein
LSEGFIRGGSRPWLSRPSQVPREQQLSEHLHRYDRADYDRFDVLLKAASAAAEAESAKDFLAIFG